MWPWRHKHGLSPAAEQSTAAMLVLQDRLSRADERTAAERRLAERVAWYEAQLDYLRARRNPE